MSKNKSFVVDTPLTLSAEFRVLNVLTDPTTEALTVEAPDGSTYEPGISDDGTGLRSAPYTPGQAGYYKFRWTSTGTAQGLREGVFYVNSSALSA